MILKEELTENKTFIYFVCFVENALHDLDMPNEELFVRRKAQASHDHGSYFLLIVSNFSSQENIKFKYKSNCIY